LPSTDIVVVDMTCVLFAARVRGEWTRLPSKLSGKGSRGVVSIDRSGSDTGFFSRHREWGCPHTLHVYTCHSCSCHSCFTTRRYFAQPFHGKPKTHCVTVLCDDLASSSMRCRLSVHTASSRTSSCTSVIPSFIPYRCWGLGTNRCTCTCTCRCECECDQDERDKGMGTHRRGSLVGAAAGSIL
jgi:hypothetical protein